MMSEQPSNNGEILIALPSRVRIRQRLGQISADRLFREEVVPGVERLGGENMAPEDLLSTLAMNLSEFATKHMLGITALAYSHIPPIIDALVDDPSQKEATLGIWGDMVMAKKARDEAEIEHIKSKILNPRRDPPRKSKKARQRSNGIPPSYKSRRRGHRY